MEMKAEQYARCIIDNLQTEAMINAWVGYSDPAESFLDFRSRYQQACTALQIGTVFYDEERVFYYRHLGLEMCIRDRVYLFRTKQKLLLNSKKIP